MLRTILSFEIRCLNPLSQLVSEVQGLEAPRGSESPPASQDMEGKEGKKQQQLALFSPLPHQKKTTPYAASILDCLQGQSIYQWIKNN